MPVTVNQIRLLRLIIFVVVKPKLSRTKSKKTSTSESDEQYLKSLADAAIEVPPFSNFFFLLSHQLTLLVQTAAQDSDSEEEAPHSDPIGDLSLSSEEDVNMNKSPGRLPGNEKLADEPKIPNHCLLYSKYKVNSFQVHRLFLM